MGRLYTDGDKVAEEGRDEERTTAQPVGKQPDTPPTGAPGS